MLCPCRQFKVVKPVEATGYERIAFKGGVDSQDAGRDPADNIGIELVFERFSHSRILPQKTPRLSNERGARVPGCMTSSNGISD